MIRIATVRDLPDILNIYAPYVENTTVSFEYTVPTAEEFQQRFYAVTTQFPWLVWEENGKVLGYAYGSAPFSRAAYAWCAEVSIYIDSCAQGHGIGKALYAVLEALLFQQGYRTLHAHITEENQASLIFHEKMGYREFAVIPKCGWKFGRWLDVVWMEKRSKCVSSPTSFPTPWSTFVEANRKSSDILAILSIS